MLDTLPAQRAGWEEGRSAPNGNFAQNLQIPKQLAVAPSKNSWITPRVAKVGLSHEAGLLEATGDRG